MEFEFTKPKVCFMKDLDIADIFMYDNLVYINISEEHVITPRTTALRFAAVCLNNGKIDFIPAQAEVIPMTAKMTLTQKL